MIQHKPPAKMDSSARILGARQVKQKSVRSSPKLSPRPVSHTSAKQSVSFTQASDEMDAREATYRESVSDTDSSASDSPSPASPVSSKKKVKNYHAASVHSYMQSAQYSR